ncbi:MAG: RimK family alpha-L-glutamate ligase [Lysobacterales bacterium]
MPPIALITCQAARPLDEDLPPLSAALTTAGIAHRIVDWDDPTVDWSDFAIALLRSTWDYVPRLAEFLAWAERVAALTELHNPLPMLRWNTDKHYLADLHAAGIATVPSRFVEPGSAAAESLAAWLDGSDPIMAGYDEFVVKPAVGAGSRDAARHRRDDRSAALAHIARLLDAGRSVLLQPYLGRVDQDGESALIYIDGEFSHAIRKGPLLAPATAPTRALFAPEAISVRAASAAERALAEGILAALNTMPACHPFVPPLYARIDLLRGDDGQPRLLELELTEPSLFFANSDAGAERFAAALSRRIASLRRSD